MSGPAHRTNIVRDLRYGIHEIETAIARLRDYDKSTKWIEVGSGSGAPAFQNGWINNGGVWATAAFMRDSSGFVHVKGLVKSGTIGGTIFTLPAGFRPAAYVTWATVANDAFARVYVQTDGQVVANSGSNVWFALDPIIFAAEL